jgi:NADPH-dependent curcumin reductase CurA
MVSNKRVIFTKISNGVPVAGEHIQVQEGTLDLETELSKGDIILKTLEISIDPYLVDRMRDPSIESYVPPFQLNQPLADNTMSVVIKSNNPDFKIGDLVFGRTQLGRFEEYVQVSAEEAKKVYVVRNDAKGNGLPLHLYVGALAMSGMTAHYG